MIVLGCPAPHPCQKSFPPTEPQIENTDFSSSILESSSYRRSYLVNANSRSKQVFNAFIAFLSFPNLPVHPRLEKMYPPEMHGRSLLHKLYPNMEDHNDIRFRLISITGFRYHTSSALPIILFRMYDNRIFHCIILISSKHNIRTIFKWKSIWETFQCLSDP